MIRRAAVLAFVVTYAVASSVSQLLSVYRFDYWEPSFGTQYDNMTLFFSTFLPFFLGIASVSFLIGLQNATFNRFGNRDAAIKVGIVGAILANLTLDLVVAVNVGGGLSLESLEFVALVAGPGLAAVVATILVEWSDDEAYDAAG